MLLEVCLSILTLVATAAIVKVHPEKNRDAGTSCVFHVEGCWHIRDKQPDMYKMCDDCLQKLKKS